MIFENLRFWWFYWFCRFSWFCVFLPITLCSKPLTPFTKHLFLTLCSKHIVPIFLNGGGGRDYERRIMNTPDFHDNRGIMRILWIWWFLKNWFSGILAQYVVFHELTILRFPHLRSNLDNWWFLSMMLSAVYHRGLQNIGLWENDNCREDIVK